jgi:hypothetical protein
MEARMIKLTESNTRKAIERARALRPRLEFIADREWLVYGRDKAEYVVTLAKHAGEIYSECTCKAGAAGVVCYHAVSAAGCQMGIAKARRLALS